MINQKNKHFRYRGATSDLSRNDSFDGWECSRKPAATRENRRGAVAIGAHFLVWPLKRLKSRAPGVMTRGRRRKVGGLTESFRLRLEHMMRGRRQRSAEKDADLTINTKPLKLGQSTGAFAGRNGGKNSTATEGNG